MGAWYEVQRYFESNEDGVDCAVSDLYLSDDNTTVTIENTGYNLDTEEFIEVNGLGWLAFPNVYPFQGVLNITFVPGAVGADRANYHVLETDYVRYAIVWGCNEISATQHQEFAWVLSRYYPVSSDDSAVIEAAIDRTGLDRNSLYTVFQHQNICLGGSITPYE